MLANLTFFLYYISMSLFAYLSIYGNRKLKRRLVMGKETLVVGSKVKKILRVDILEYPFCFPGFSMLNLINHTSSATHDMIYFYTELPLRPYDSTSWHCTKHSMLKRQSWFTVQGTDQDFLLSVSPQQRFKCREIVT